MRDVPAASRKAFLLMRRLLVRNGKEIGPAADGPYPLEQLVFHLNPDLLRIRRKLVHVFQK